MFNAGVAGPGASLESVDDALGELRENGLPWFWFVLPQTPSEVSERVAAAGARAFDERAPWMEIERTALPPPDPPTGVSIVEALAEPEVRSWAETLRTIYGFPDVGRDSWIAAALRRDAAAPQFRLWTIVSDESPVAVTLGFVADGIVAQFGVGVPAEQRGRGYGRLVTLVPPSQLDAPVAGHWATPDGERLYGRLGMTTDGWVTRHLGDPP